jgi:hypothetical protein
MVIIRAMILTSLDDAAEKMNVIEMSFFLVRTEGNYVAMIRGAHTQILSLADCREMGGATPF